MKVTIDRHAVQESIRDYTFFLEYIKILGMVLFAISLTTPVLGLVVFDVDSEVAGKQGALAQQLIWDKPILPYVAGFVILIIQWFKFVEVHHHLKTTNLKHILIVMAFFFVLCLYPFFEMNIEFTSDQPHSRAVFSFAWGLLGLFQYWQLHYAFQHGLLKNGLTKGRADAIKREVLADPLVALICIALSYTSLLIWIAGMIVLVPVMNVIMAKISIKKGH